VGVVDELARQGGWSNLFPTSHDTRERSPRSVLPHELVHKVEHLRIGRVEPKALDKAIIEG
ncbi:MAG: hypothetical protein LC667_06525, partial [Thioalkalivibrio sp.]|nr:hypothetical protein [Thioalkalivibrio sp.]